MQSRRPRSCKHYLQQSVRIYWNSLVAQNVGELMQQGYVSLVSLIHNNGARVRQSARVNTQSYA